MRSLEMFGAVFRFELLRLWATRLGPILLVLGAALALFALDTGVRHARQLETTIAEAHEERAHAIENFRRQAGADPFAAAEDDVLALPLRPSAALSIGQSDLMPALLGAGVMNAARLGADRYGFDNPAHLMTGRFDLTTFVLLIVPLFVIALSFDLLSGERESGTLKLVLSHAIGLAPLMMGKLAARAVLVLAVALAIPIAGLALMHPHALQDGASLGLWALCVLGYVWVWFAACAFLAVGRTRSSTNALILIGLWLLLVSVAPALLQIAATARHPVPTRVEAVMASRENPQDYFPAIPALARAWYARHPELQTPAHNAATVAQSFPAGLFLVQENMDRQADETNARIEAELLRQREFVGAFAWVSPAIALKGALNTLAGADTGRYQAFRMQANAFRARWRAHFAVPILHALPMTERDFVTLPPFAFEEPRARQQRTLAAALCVMAAWAGLLSLAALIRARRFAVLA